jgi:hypothetical protein
MSVESYDSNGFFEDTIEEPKASHRALVEQILEDETSLQNIRDFMWNYVGHPERDRRLAGEQPRLHRLGMEYSRELFTGYSEDGDLFHVRAIPGLLTEPKGYVVVWGSMKYGASEAVVHRVQAIGGIAPHDTRLQLLDRNAMDNSPWGHCPGQYAPPYDQFIFRQWTNGAGEVQVDYREARTRHVELYPIEQLYTTMDYIEAERTVLARSALQLYETVDRIEAGRGTMARSALTLVTSS